MHINRRYHIIFFFLLNFFSFKSVLADDSATGASGQNEMRKFLDGLHLRIYASQVTSFTIDNNNAVEFTHEITVDYLTF
jgi:hypothetical protein